MLVTLALAFAIRRKPKTPGSSPIVTTSAASVVAPASAITSSGTWDAGSVSSPRALHGDARRQHRSRFVGPVAPKLVWARDVGGAVESQVVTSPDESTLYVTTLAGKLVALSRDGAIRWTVDLGDRVYGTPLVGDDGTLYVGSDSKRFYAVSKGGAIVWKLDVDGEADTSAALAPGPRIVFAAGRMVYALALDGTVTWRFAAKEKVFSSPAVTASGLVVFGAQDGGGYGVDASGKRAFYIDFGADVDASPAIGDDGAIYWGTDGGDVARSNEQGELAWKTHVGGFVRGALSIARSGDLLAGTYGPTPRVVRVTSAGVLAGWLPIQGTGAAEFGIHGGPLEDEAHTLFFGAQDDAIHVVRADGSEARFETGGDVDAPITILSDGSIVVGSDDGKVVCVR